MIKFINVCHNNRCRYPVNITTNTFLHTYWTIISLQLLLEICLSNQSFNALKLRRVLKLGRCFKKLLQNRRDGPTGAYRGPFELVAFLGVTQTNFQPYWVITS